jgi:uncharacterized protein YdaT
MVATKAAIQIADAATDQGYIERRPEVVAAVELKQFPAYLNRWDSQQARNEGVFAH